MSFSCANNERYNDALVALAEGKYDAPAVMPLPSNAPHHSPRWSAKITWFWNPTPIQKAVPAIVALR